MLCGLKSAGVGIGRVGAGIFAVIRVVTPIITITWPLSIEQEKTAIPR